MADKAISALPSAQEITLTDLFVLEQSQAAKSITGQLLVSELASYLDGHGGINNIAYTPPSSGSLTGTMTITYADGTTTTFNVTNGKGITSITKTAAVPPSLRDSYRILYNDNTYYDFTVDNGRGITSISWATSGTAGDGQTHTGTITYNDGTTSTITFQDGVKGDKGDQTYVHIKYSSTADPSDTDMGDSPDSYIGIYTGTTSTAPTTASSYTWFKWKGETGDTGTSITDISYVSSSGDVDTYRITMSDGDTSTFTVTNGSSIQSITLTSQSVLTDTYTVLLTNGNTTTFTVTNGKSIQSITMVSGSHAAGTSDTYRILFNDNDTFDFQVYNGANGTGAVSSVAGIGVDGANGDVPLIKWGNGAPTTAMIGQEKQLYFDLSGGIMYICTADAGDGTYSWASMGITVDSVLSSSSSNPVANSVLTNIIGTATLDTTAQTLTGAINELEGGVDNLQSGLSSLQTAIGNKGRMYTTEPLTTLFTNVSNDEFEVFSAAADMTSLLTNGDYSGLSYGFAVFHPNNNIVEVLIMATGSSKIYTCRIASNGTLSYVRDVGVTDITSGKVLYYTNVACSATTGDFVNYSNTEISNEHILAECVFANPSAIRAGVTWTTTSGNLKLNGTCATATTCNVVLIKKDN